MTRITPLKRPWISRGLLAGAVVAGFVALPGGTSTRSSAAETLYDGPIADAPCDAGSLPETTQGRVSAADINDGRAAMGYTCNAHQLSHITNTGGFRVEQYADAAGHTCAYEDSTLLYPKDVAANGVEGPGTYVIDVTDPANPVITDTLVTPAMQSPHESLRVNTKRGLLAADLGNPASNLGFVDVYDLTKDCRTPVLDSSTPLGILGHESGFAPDGMTFYVSSPGGGSISAVDLTNPVLPSIAWLSFNVPSPHGVSVSDDGNRLYIASDTSPGQLTILDVSQVQARVPNPTVPTIATLVWPNGSIPQIARPFTNGGHHYLASDDEYTTKTLNPTTTDPVAGAARIINIDDEKHPYVVSNIRLEVQEPDALIGDEAGDPGAESPVQGYGAHYCSIPTELSPTIMACSEILSGLRIFDIHDPAHPTEVGYFNGPVVPGVPVQHEGSFAMSSPNYDVARGLVYYSDGNSGFYAVQLTGAALQALRGTTATAAAPTATSSPAPATTPAAPAPPYRTTTLRVGGRGPVRPTQKRTYTLRLFVDPGAGTAPTFAGRPLGFYVDGKLRARLITGRDGTIKYTVKFPVGSHVVAAVFYGTGDLRKSTSPGQKVHSAR